jgi:acyl-CoA synthetase (AMP-forming)/AMP-acid ligase II
VFVHDIAWQAARRSPEAVAIIDGATVLTFAEVARRAACIGAVLGAEHPPGSLVAVIADNRSEWIDCYYGVPRAGLVLMPVNQRLAPVEQAEIIRRARAAVVLGAPEHLDALRAVGGLASCARVVAFGDDYEDLLQASGSNLMARASGMDDVAWMLFTSGTTSAPKGVQLTHRNIVTGATTACLARSVGGDEVYLYPFPLCHIAGHNVLALHLKARPAVLMSRFTVDGFLDAVERHGVTSTSLAPTMLHSLVGELEAGHCIPPPTLRSVSYGSAPMALPLLQRAMEVLPGVGFSQGYGMTELAGNVAYLTPDDHRRGAVDTPARLRSAGRAGPLVALNVVDREGNSCAPGTAGEIVAHGDQVHLGYFEDPGADAASFFLDEEGRRWFRTGDVGVFDGEGYLTIVDRVKDIVVTGGENVSSREVEDVVAGCPGVAEVAVIGVPDEHWGESVCAFVVLRSDADVAPDEIRAYAGARLAGFKTPRRIVLVPQLPRNLAGKVLKAELRASVTDRRH